VEDAGLRTSIDRSISARPINRDQRVELPNRRSPMKSILLTAGGTATTWHLASVIRTVFPGSFRTVICDINPPHLIPASILADQFHQVPPASDPSYRQVMLDVLQSESIDILVPLIDHDVYQFCADDPDLARTGTSSTGVASSTAECLRDKGKTSDFLERALIPVPRRISAEEFMDGDEEFYFAKPLAGFGSRGARKVARRAEDFASVDFSSTIVQELCEGPEVTVEVFNASGKIRTVCRERIETKAGVCTKARIWFDDELNDMAVRICTVLEMPVAFCFQVMRTRRLGWVVTDLNPRLGAGTALSTAYGWSLAAAALATWGRLDRDPEEFLKVRGTDTFVVRTFQEILMPC